jgi:serine/threonine-protein kinase
VSAYLAFSFWVRRGVTPVPTLAGRTEAEAREELVEHGLTPRLAEVRRFSTEVAQNLVVETQPRGGSLVKRGSRVEVVLSLGARRIVVPDLTGKSPAAARLTLEGEGLTVGSTLSVRSRRGPAGTVVGQQPPPGAELPGETDVALLVAQPQSAPAWIMPDLVARRYEAVRAALEGAGFRFGNVTFEPYESVQPGTILRQTPLPGHPLRRESSIGLVVATDALGVTP